MTLHLFKKILLYLSGIYLLYMMIFYQGKAEQDCVSSLYILYLNIFVLLLNNNFYQSVLY